MSTLLSRESLIVHNFIFIKCSKTKNTMQNNECDQCRDTGTASGGRFLHRCVPRPWLILVSDPNTTDTTHRLKTKLSGEWNRTWSRGPRSHDLHEHHLLAVTNIASCPQPHVHRTLQTIVIMIQHWWFYTSVCITPVTQEQCSDSGWNKDWCVCVCVCVDSTSYSMPHSQQHFLLCSLTLTLILWWRHWSNSGLISCPKIFGVQTGGSQGSTHRSAQWMTCSTSWATATPCPRTVLTQLSWLE